MFSEVIVFVYVYGKQKIRKFLKSFLVNIICLFKTCKTCLVSKNIDKIYSHLQLYEHERVIVNYLLTIFNWRKKS